ADVSGLRPRNGRDGNVRDEPRRTERRGSRGGERRVRRGAGRYCRPGLRGGGPRGGNPGGPPLFPDKKGRTERKTPPLDWLRLSTARHRPEQDLTSKRW